MVMFIDARRLKTAMNIVPARARANRVRARRHLRRKVLRRESNSGRGKPRTALHQAVETALSKMTAAETVGRDRLTHRHARSAHTGKSVARMGMPMATMSWMIRVDVGKINPPGR